MMEAVRTFETSANFNLTTWHYIPEVSKLQVYSFLNIILSFQIIFLELAVCLSWQGSPE
jgi:hypothetical protein